MFFKVGNTFLTILIACSILQAQNVYNGAALTIESGVQLYTDDFTNQGSGTIDNSGTINLTGDWTNNAGNSAFINSSPGSVDLEGGNQTIGGSSSTLFNDLNLSGSGVKTLNIDASFEGILALGDRELNTQANTLSGTSTSTGSVTRTSGFISSDLGGALARNTNATSAYLFPVGSSQGTLRYRPVEITPYSASAHTFAVRMANVDATTEGFDRNVTDGIVNLNANYYHDISRTSGTSAADVSIFYDGGDGNFVGMGHWQGLPQWEDVGAVNIALGSPLNSITVQGWNTFSPFILFSGAQNIPTLSQWGMISLTLLILCIGSISVWKNQYGIGIVRQAS